MASWNHDGTQDPGPPPLLSDPLSGLVTGGKYDAESVRVRVVEPSTPDIEAVREAMASVLDENSELRMAVPEVLVVPVPEPDLGANDPDAGDGGTDVGPAVGAPTAAVVVLPPTPPVGIPVQRVVPAVPAMLPRRRGRVPRPLRPGGRGTFSPGLAAVGLLLLVIGVLVIVMLANLIDTISSLFS